VVSYLCLKGEEWKGDGERFIYQAVVSCQAVGALYSCLVLPSNYVLLRDTGMVYHSQHYVWDIVTVFVMVQCEFENR
jgi:hypothetical protein